MDSKFACDEKQNDGKGALTNPSEAINDRSGNPQASDEQLQEHNSTQNGWQRIHQDAVNAPESSQQNAYKPQQKRLMSVEHIPESHQTLKMRLKLRPPVIKPENPEVPEMKKDVSEEKYDKEATVEQRVRRKRRGRPPAPVKKEQKKFLQISLGNQADRWQEVKNLTRSLKFHSQVAKLLLDW